MGVLRASTGAHGGHAAFTVSAVALGGLLSGAPVAAQEATVEPNAAQTQLNEEAVSATRAGDLKKAAQLFEASLQLGELNITWLNLGRTLFKLDRCEEASAAYAQALVAPAVAAPSPTEIARTVARYSSELEQTCPGAVEIVCDPNEMEVQLDGGELQPCPGAPVPIPNGAHEVVGRLGERRTAIGFTVKAMETVSVRLTLDPLPAPAGNESFPFTTAGYTATGVGGALLLGALLVDALVLQPDLDELDALKTGADRLAFDDLKASTEGTQTLNLGLLAGGTALVITGAVLVLLAPDAASETPTAVGWNVLAAPHAGGVQWSSAW